MVPAAIVALEAMPLTANGKLDRRGLPPPDEKNLLHENGTIPPRRPVEAALAEIWSRALGTAEIGIGDDFFALGGDSLRATRVVSRIRDAFGVELPLRAIFESRTIAQLAARIDAAREDKSRSSIASRILPVSRAALLAAATPSPPGGVATEEG